MDLSVHENYYKFCPNCKTMLQRKTIDKRKRFFCPACNFIFWNNPKPVVSILIHKDNQVLMLQRAEDPLKNYWCLPGGYINYDEQLEAAVKRESAEELGVDVTIESLVGVYRIDNDPRGINIDIIYCGKSKGAIHLSREDKKFAYFKLNQLPEKIAYKHRQVIQAWAKNKKLL